MIFITVGTHEQPFDRLVKEVDRLKRENVIREDVFIQTGYSTYKPQACAYREFIRFDEMMHRIEEADIVITHGGTGSIMLVLYHQKIPVVVPRQKKHREHIDDHQVLFCKTMVSKQKILAVYETGELGPTLSGYWQQVQQLHRREDRNEPKKEPGLHAFRADENAALFARRLNEICLDLVRKT
jgi:UDP-N-acetylglucosamine transferase subunit ALG13